MTNWIACTERMPEPDVRVLVYPGLQGEVEDAIYRQLGTGLHWVDGYGSDDDFMLHEAPTHWMPLPEPPL